MEGKECHLKVAFHMMLKSYFLREERMNSELRRKHYFWERLIGGLKNINSFSP